MKKKKSYKKNTTHTNPPNNGDKRKMKFFTIRSNQIISPFGPGSIFESESQSFIIKTTDKWAHWNGDPLDDEPRLRKLLKVNKFLKPKLSEDIKDSMIKIFRFPQWHFCSERICNRMYKFPHDEIIEANNKPKCPVCQKGILIPMRFILACANGHIQDVPWGLWAHKSKKTTCTDDKNLIFYSEGKSSGLDSLKIKCNSCKAVESLAGITSSETIERLKWQCHGSQPWEYIAHTKGETACNIIPVVLQKGASNVHFPVTKTAIDIPNEYRKIAESDNYNDIRQDSNYISLLGSLKDYAKGNIQLLLQNPMAFNLFNSIVHKFHTAHNISLDTLIDIMVADYEASLNEQNNANTVSVEYDETDFKFEEYRSFTSSNLVKNFPRLILHNRNEDIFKYKNSTDDSQIKSIIEVSQKFIKRILEVEKLRVVRVFKGFYRLDFPTSVLFNSVESNSIQFKDYSDNKHSAKEVKADLGKTDWLPATENYGEGLFFEFNRSELIRFFDERFISRHQDIHSDPVTVFIHTFSHLMIRQLAFECGYPAASIQERIYSSDREGTPMSGLLIYTASGDSYGSLGGLSSLSTPDKLFPIIYNAVKSAEWCSNDPLCGESGPQGLYNANLAACHSCTLLPETSCEMLNTALDRVSVIGNIQNTLPGIFSELLKIGDL